MGQDRARQSLEGDDFLGALGHGPLGLSRARGAHTPLAKEQCPLISEKLSMPEHGIVRRVLRNNPKLFKRLRFLRRSCSPRGR